MHASSSLRRTLQLVFPCAVAICLLPSCSTPDLVWNPDARSMTNLRSLRLKGDRPSVTLDKDVTLHADRIDYHDKRRRVGEAVGRVYLEVGPAGRYGWLVEHGYAERAAFDRRDHWLMLHGHAMLEREKMTQIATAPYTELEIRWGHLTSDIIVRGPTRTDFAKSNPVPPGVTVHDAAVGSSAPAVAAPGRQSESSRGVPRFPVKN
ncbi:hypothetical protein [Verrucomicrobium spinosum]|uniref:hypothetical protein n=1 Tax=Verrucomicrobium spinosum TaxID=2736 RepID=UPI0001746AE0|nr:hypothetical protein [Verrucomicrobium spinosum]